MCAGAIVLARIDTVVWGLDDSKRGGGTTFGVFDHPGINHHPLIVRGVLEEPCRAVLQNFFRARRGFLLRPFFLQGVFELVQPFQHGGPAVVEGFRTFFLEVFDDLHALVRIGQEQQGGTRDGAGQEGEK